jgi:hypothetical protein
VRHGVPSIGIRHLADNHTNTQGVLAKCESPMASCERLSFDITGRRKQGSNHVGVYVYVMSKCTHFSCERVGLGLRSDHPQLSSDQRIPQLNPDDVPSFFLSARPVGQVSSVFCCWTNLLLRQSISCRHVSIRILAERSVSVGCSSYSASLSASALVWNACQSSCELLQVFEFSGGTAVRDQKLRRAAIWNDRGPPEPKT